MTDSWTTSYRKGREYVEDLNGEDWYVTYKQLSRWARLRHFTHRPQTRGNLGGEYVERCRCGAMRLDSYGPWQRYR